MQDIQINLPTQLVELSFHDRAAIVARDILVQIGVNDEKVRQLEMMTGLVNSLPAIGQVGKVQKILKDIEPLLSAVRSNSDPGYYIRAIPQERIEYFLNLVITRLEWIKNGN
jgi:hypothetical protein